MCGIYGYISINNYEMKKSQLSLLVRYLTLENISRGTDSTGIGFVNSGNQYADLRKVKDGEQFLKTAFANKILEQNLNREVRKVLGHTRWATTGKVNLTNAQPFRYGNIVGTHNGVVDNYESLFEEFKLKNFTTCDSEILFALLDRMNSSDKKAQVLGRINGYFALSFHDFRQPEKHFFALGNNDCAIRISKDKTFLVYSSEAEVLDYAESLFGIKLDEIKAFDGELIEVNTRTGKYQTFDIPLKKYYPSARTTVTFLDEWQKTGTVSMKMDDECYACGGEKDLLFEEENGLTICENCDLIQTNALLNDN